MAVKALSLRGLGDWKQLQLFEREAATLRGLSHPCIPAYLDYFEADTERDRGFFLVQVPMTEPLHHLERIAADVWLFLQIRPAVCAEPCA